MQLYSERAELSALRSICNNGPATGSLLSTLSRHHFHNPMVQESFEHVRATAKAGGEVPEWPELLISSGLDAETRRYLSKKGKQVEVVKSVKTALKLRSKLDEWMKLRLFYHQNKRVLQALSEPKADLTSLVEEMSTVIGKIRGGIPIEKKLLHIGKGNNSRKEVERIIAGNVVPVIPTGFKVFDDVNGGFMEQGVVILTANTGGLKTTMAKTLAHNIYLAGYNTAFCSFEMSFDECIYRLLSADTEIGSDRFMRGLLDRREQRIALKKYEEWVEFGKSKGCRFTIMPAEDADLGIDQVLATLQPFGYKVIFIDYISLLADNDSEEQWKALGYVARKSKMFAKKNNCVVVLLAQLSDDDKIRYSRAIGEHASNWWRWRIGDNERANGFFEVHQGKARNQKVFPFQLAIDFEYQRITDLMDKAFDGHKNKEVAEQRTKTFKIDGKSGIKDLADKTYYTQ